MKCQLYYFQGNKDRYMAKHDKEMLKKVVKGNGVCKSDNDCTASDRDLGYCLNKRCVCNEGYTGPFCLVSAIVCFSIWQQTKVN